MFLPYINKSDDDDDGLITGATYMWGAYYSGACMWRAYNLGDVYVAGF